MKNDLTVTKARFESEKIDLFHRLDVKDDLVTSFSKDVAKYQLEL